MPHKGHKASAETRAKMSAARSARYADPAEREKQRQIQKAKWTAHGYVGTPTYHTWSGMRARCTNPKNKEYARYGGRGITVCEQWDHFVNFLADMGEKPPGTSIDRIDNAGNYEPGNCRWATAHEQRMNQRPRGTALVR